MSGKAIIATLFSFCAGIGFSILAIYKAVMMKRARDWPSVRGRILESITYKDPQSKQTHFRVRYEFNVGERIEAATPRLCGDWFWGKDQERFVARYSPGQEVDVFYDPQNPGKNCLDRIDRSGITAMWVLGVGGTALAVLLIWLHAEELGIAG